MERDSNRGRNKKEIDNPSDHQNKGGWAHARKVDPELTQEKNINPTRLTREQIEEKAQQIVDGIDLEKLEKEAPNTYHKLMERIFRDSKGFQLMSSPDDHPLPQLQKWLDENRTKVYPGQYNTDDLETMIQIDQRTLLEKVADGLYQKDASTRIAKGESFLVPEDHDDWLKNGGAFSPERLKIIESRNPKNYDPDINEAIGQSFDSFISKLQGEGPLDSIANGSFLYAQADYDLKEKWGINNYSLVPLPSSIQDRILKSIGKRMLSDGVPRAQIEQVTMSRNYLNLPESILDFYKNKK